MTPWTIACQAPLSIGFPRQEYWSGLPCPPPVDLLTQGLNPCLLLGRQILYHWAIWETHPSLIHAKDTRIIDNTMEHTRQIHKTTIQHTQHTEQENCNTKLPSCHRRPDSSVIPKVATCRWTQCVLFWACIYSIQEPQIHPQLCVPPGEGSEEGCNNGSKRVWTVLDILLTGRW